MFRVFLFLFFVFYLLSGLAISSVLFNHWARLKGFKKDFAARLVGIFFWPWVLRVVQRPQISGKEFLKDKASTIVSDDRDKKEKFLRDWTANYSGANPKIDKEAVYQLRIYPPGRR